MRSYASWGARVSLYFILVFLFTFVFIVSSDSLYIEIISHSIHLFMYYLMWTFICVSVVIVKYHSRFITCSGYLSLCTYTWGILLVCMHRRLSSCLRFSIFGKRSMTVELCYRGSERRKFLQQNLNPEWLEYLSDDL